ncbi:late embryogenesis abundant protein At5g17165-like [Triticum dicoccoides]|uniref:Seed specific protein Bn15D1B n=1 Tax=Triticum aestivum TaxID=4565 RepID=A0A3B6CCC3_WHEAT|nr:late embryogenesis abundant protein At5g17165-like [Triticum dicoccoides]XP_044325928.1 late embryogenesis abundant protein At5g17165-like [Triticum aestivum]
MAAVASSKGRVIAGSLVARVLAGKANASPRRAVHASAYDKNVDEQVRPAFVPDDVIGGAGSPDKYWGPHPTTGVFGPAAVDPKLAASLAPAAGAANGGASVLDQKVWFRPLEDVEKPPVA